MRRQCRYVLAEEADGTRSRRKIAGHAVKQRRLAGAVRTEHGAPLARAHTQRDIRQRRERPKHPAHTAQFDRVAGAGCGHAFGDRAQWPLLLPLLLALPEPETRLAMRRQRPITPSGGNNTITRKPRAMSSWKRRPSSPTATSASSANVRKMT